MKKAIFCAVFALLGLSIFTPAKAVLMGFSDGSLYNPDVSVTEPEYICFLNGECLKKDGTTTTRKELGLDPLPNPLPEPTPNTGTGSFPILPAGTVLPPANSTSTQVSFHELVGHHTSYLTTDNRLWFAIDGVSVNDKIYLTFNNQEYSVVATKDNMQNSDIGQRGGKMVGFEIKNLLPDTSYSFTIRIYRGDTYGIDTGTVTTIKN